MNRAEQACDFVLPGPCQGDVLLHLRRLCQASAGLWWHLDGTGCRERQAAVAGLLQPAYLLSFACACEPKDVPQKCVWQAHTCRSQQEGSCCWQRHLLQTMVTSM